MMTKQGVGKGLDIKGKSAKKGVLSGFVPFLQIHEEKHKRKIKTLPKFKLSSDKHLVETNASAQQ